MSKVQGLINLVETIQTIKKMCIDLMCVASFNKKLHDDTQKKMMWVCHIHHLEWQNI